MEFAGEVMDPRLGAGMGKMSLRYPVVPENKHLKKDGSFHKRPRAQPDEVPNH